MIDAECYHFIRFLKVIRNAEMSAACATTKNIIIVVRKYDENDCRKLLKPFHLAHELHMVQGGGGMNKAVINWTSLGVALENKVEQAICTFDANFT